jgi:hypothetical protein
MSSARCAVAAMATAFVVATTARAVGPPLTDRDVERALKLAQASADARAAFHALYIVNVNDATLERLEVVTEFRRYVATTEEQLRLGRWLFAQSIKDAREMLRPWAGRLTLVARLRFHPQNTLSSLPAYDLTIGNPDLLPLDVVRTPITALSGNAREVFAPIMAATIEAVFEAPPIAQTTRPIRLSLAGREVARLTVDFSKLE